MTDIKSMYPQELSALMEALGEKAFRAKQLYSWLHEHMVLSYEDMANLPKSLKEKLKDYPITGLKLVDEQISAIDGTRKYLFGLADGNVIESVLMRYRHGNSVCISSQVGCRMGVHHRRPDQKPYGVGNAGTDLPHSGAHRRTGGKRGGHGDRRTFG